MKRCFSSGTASLQSSSSTMFLLCDIQDKFVPRLYGSDALIHSSKILLNFANTIDAPIAVSEQYPEGLGHTHYELQECYKERDEKDVIVYPKTKFSMLTPELENFIQDRNDSLENIVLFGIESHVCVLQTVMDLVNYPDKKFKIYCPVDAMTSQKNGERHVAFKRMETLGSSVILTTTESCILELVKDANHPNFRNISKLLKDLGGPRDGENGKSFRSLLEG
eukprot:g3926.t1